LKAWYDAGVKWFQFQIDNCDVGPSNKVHFIHGHWTPLDPPSTQTDLGPDDRSTVTPAELVKQNGEEERLSSIWMKQSMQHSKQLLSEKLNGIISATSTTIESLKLMCDQIVDADSKTKLGGVSKEQRKINEIKLKFVEIHGAHTPSNADEAQILKHHDDTITKCVNNFYESHPGLPRTDMPLSRIFLIPHGIRWSSVSGKA
jgi:hypothetical protein